MSVRFRLWLPALAVVMGPAMFVLLLTAALPARASFQDQAPQWSQPDPFPSGARFLADVGCNNPPPDQMPVIEYGYYWSRLGERTPGRSINRRDEFKINLKAGQLLRMRLYAEAGGLAINISRITTSKKGQKVRHIYQARRCRDFPGYAAEINYTPLHDGEYRVGVYNPAIKAPVERYLLQVGVMDNNQAATGQCAGRPAPGPGIERKVTHAVEGWRAGNGRAQWSYDNQTGLVRVWAHSYADTFSQVANATVIADERETVKVLDYQTFEVTGIPGAIYRGNITAVIDLKGIIDRLDSSSVAGSSATQYHAELLWGLAETTSPRQIELVHGVRFPIWRVKNNLWKDLAMDIAVAVLSGAVSAAVPVDAKAMTNVMYYKMITLGSVFGGYVSALGFHIDRIQCDEVVANRYNLSLQHLNLQAGKQYMVYAMLIGRVRSASLGISAGVCELDFWYREPSFCDKGGDPLEGRGFKLTSYEVTFPKTDDKHPCTPMSPDPADGARLTPMGRPLTIKWQGGDPEGQIVLYDLYWGEVNPPPLFAGGLTAAEATVLCQGNKSYFWRVEAADQKGNKTLGPLWHYSTWPTNHNPLTPQAITPASGKTNVEANTRLAWQARDPDGDPLTYEVTLTKSGDGAVVFQGATTDNNLGLPTPLEPGVHYTWTVKATDGRGGQSTNTFFFTTVNHAPARPYNPTPANQAGGVDPAQPLTCHVQDPEGDPLTCDLYLGPANLPLPALPTVSNAPPDADGKVTFRPTLSPGATYKWRVVVKDQLVRQVSSPTWSFTTRAD